MFQIYNIDSVILLVSTIVMSVVLTIIAREILKKLKFWNAKDDEHKDIIVRGGGIAVAVVFFVLSYTFAYFHNSFCIAELNKFTIGAVPLIIVGILDDKYNLNAKLKLFVQLSSISFLYFSDYKIDYLFGINLPEFISFGATVLWGVAILNAFNLIDGLDGLCAGNSFFSAVGMFLLGSMLDNTFVMLISLIIGGACVGFLVFNSHPATIFLGDTGSLFLGYSFAFLSLFLMNGNFNLTNTSVLLLLFWIPFCDIGLAVWRRKVKGMLRKSFKNKVMERDLHHIHYRLLRVMNSHRLTVLVLWGIIGLLNCVAFLILKLNSISATLIIMITIGVLSLIILAQYELRYSYTLGKKVVKNVNKKLNKQNKKKIQI